MAIKTAKAKKCESDYKKLVRQKIRAEVFRALGGYFIYEIGTEKIKCSECGCVRKKDVPTYVSLGYGDTIGGAWKAAAKKLKLI